MIAFADTASNKATYESKASENGMTLSEWIRDALIREAAGSRRKRK